MTSLASLNTTLSSAVQNKKLVLDDSILDSSLLAPFPKDALPLDEVLLELKDKSLVLTGSITEDWPLVGSPLVVSSLKLSANFTVNKKIVSVAFNFEGEVVAGTTSIAVAGAVDKDALSFSLSNPQKASITELVNSFSGGASSAAVPTLAILNSLSLSALEISLAYKKVKTDVKLGFSINKTWSLIPQVLIVGDLGAELEFNYSKEGGGSSFVYSGVLRGSVSAGLAYTVEVPFNSNSNIDIIIRSASNAVPSILDLASLLGGAPLRASMKSTLTAIKLTDITIDTATLSFDTVAKKLLFITADAHMLIAGLDAAVAIRIPGNPKAKSSHWRIDVSAAKDQPLSLGDFVAAMSKKFGALNLPTIVASTDVSNISMSANTGTQSLRVGFDTDIALSSTQKMDTHVDIVIEKATRGFTKSFSGYLLFNGLQFELDFSSSESTTSFRAVYTNSQNLPENEGQPGYGISAPSSGKLYDVIGKILPPYVNSAIPTELKQSLNIITLSDKSIAIANIATVSYSNISITYSKTDTASTWTLGFVGCIELGGFASLEGTFSIEIGETNAISFVSDEHSGTLATIPFPLPVKGTPPTIEPKIDSIRFSKKASSFEFESRVAVNFVGFKGVLDDVLPDTSFATLTVSNSVQTLTISELVEGVEIPLPDIPVPGSRDVELGKMLLKLSNFTVTTGSNASLSLDVDFGLPSKLNNLFGTSGGKPNFEIFTRYDPANPETSVVKTRVVADGKKLSAKLMTSPLKAVSSFERDGKAWWKVDMGDFGEADIMVPEFSYVPGSPGLTASGGFDIVRPLSIPLTPLKWFLQAALSQEVADAIPSAVPLKEIKILDDNDNLNIGEFKKLWGGNFPSEVEDVIDVLDGGIHKLPDRLKSYFNIQIPQSLMFDITIDASGGVQGSLSVKKNDPPLRVLYPGMAGPLPALNGLEIRKIAFGEILSGQLFTFEIDASFDQFNILTIAASLAMPNSDANILPKSQNLQTTLELKNLFAIIFYQAGIPIPIPLFYDRIGIDYLGFEGLGVGSHFSLPKPSANFSELAGVLSQFSEFFTDKNYLLDVNNPPQDSDLKFTIGGNYLQLPNYTGGKLLGKKSTIEVISAWQLLAHALNWLKTFSVNEFIQSFPLKHRIGKESISFFNIAGINVAWAVTTPYEFTEVAYKKLNIKAEDRDSVLAVLPEEADEKDEGLVVFMSGGFNVANTIKFQSIMGLMGSSVDGFATGFSHKGSLANIVNAELSGAIALNPSKAPHFQLIGKTKLSIFEQTVMAGELYLSEQKLIVSGLIDLFPGIDIVTARAEIQGEFSSNKVSLEGKADLKFKDVSIIQGQLRLTENEFFIKGKFLALETQLDIKKENQDLCITGHVGTNLNLPIKTGAIVIAGVKVADGISLNISTALGLTVKVSDDLFSLGVNAKFKVNGKGFDVSFTLNIVPSDIAEVTKALIKRILAEIEKYFLAMYKDAAAWIEGVASGAITLASNTAKNAAKVFSSTYKKTAKETTALLKSAGHTIEDIGGALKDVYTQTGQQVSKLLKGAGYVAEDVGKALASAFDSSAEEAAKLLKGAGYVAEDIGRAMEKTFNQGAQDVAKILKGVGHTAEDVSKALEKTFSVGAQQTATLLKGAGFVANDVGRAMQQTFKKGAQDAAKLLSGAGYAAQDVGKALKTTFKQTAANAAKLLKGAGFVANQVGSALKSSFSMGVKDAARALKSAGFLANDVGKAMKSAFGASAKTAASVLKAAGYSANQVGSALKSGFGVSTNEAVKVLKSAGYTASQVGGAIKGTFTNSAATAAKALKSAGYSASQAADVMKNTFNASASDVAKAMKSTFNLGSNAVEGILKSVKFSGSAISGVMKDVFNIIPFVKLPHVKHIKIPHIKHIKFW